MVFIQTLLTNLTLLYNMCHMAGNALSLSGTHNFTDGGGGGGLMISPIRYIYIIEYVSLRTMFMD